MKRTIVVFEDEPPIRHLIKLVLESKGYDVKLFENAKEGVRYIMEHHSPDLILLDIMMPEVDGFKVLKYIKSKSSLNDIPIILLTALSQQSVVLQGIKLGAVDYIRKPFHPQKMLERIQKHIK